METMLNSFMLESRATLQNLADRVKNLEAAVAPSSTLPSGATVTRSTPSPCTKTTKEPQSINYSDLARRYGLHDQKLRNMIVKEYLIEQGVDLQRFQQFHRCSIVRAGPAGRRKRKGEIKPFKGMTVEEMQIVCMARGLSDKEKSKQLKQTLKDHLKGVQRVPALLINDQDKSLKDINLGMYEVLPTEPLHDVKEHISNVVSEIIPHPNDNEKALFEKTLELVAGTKDQLRASDYQEMAIVLAKQLLGFVSDKVQTLLDTLTEISSILYVKPEERCPRNILRLHNQTFLHAIACEEVIGKPRILTEKKFYGRYLHSLVVHAPIQHRIICCRSTNTEQQERHFSTLSSISVTTSSRKPGEIITLES
ncbi:hypothetical protein ACROYT_G015050 [Oculina patagonica]